MHIFVLECGVCCFTILTDYKFEVNLKRLKMTNTNFITTTLSSGAKLILKYISKNKEATVETQLIAKLPVT
jgi:hypothetical protein